MKMKIGVAGYSGPINQPPVSDIKDLCEELGTAIAREGHILVNGGRDGVMELVSKAAARAGGHVVGILPFEDKGNEYLSLAISTGLDFQMRSFIMLKNVDVLIAVGGEIGTAIEILGAYAYAIPIILMRGSGGWTDRIVDVLIDRRFLDNRRKVEVFQAWTVEEAMGIISGRPWEVTSKW
ncbi:MAG: hypothetical protein PWP37_203 [Thermotogota bacterium]|nr:hypothetical protein [Thermotogota bacterium]MDK2864011.1 hypothetical protein [Thermotogota bacterium]